MRRMRTTPRGSTGSRVAHATLIAASLWMLSSGAVAAPPAFNDRLEAGRAALRAGDAATAQRELEAALTVIPNHPNALRDYGRALEAGGDLDAAARSFDKALKSEKMRTRETQIELLSALEGVARRQGRTADADGFAEQARQMRASSAASVSRTAPHSGVAGSVTKSAIDAPIERAKALEGPFASLQALCEGLASQGHFSGPLTCDPGASDFIGHVTPIRAPVFEAMYFAPSRVDGSPFVVAMRLPSGWWGSAGAHRLLGPLHEYRLQTIKVNLRQDPVGAIVALRIRHRAWKTGGSPDAIDADVEDAILVCGMSSNELPGCLPERVLGAPNRAQVDVTDEGVIQIRGGKNPGTFAPVFP